MTRIPKVFLSEMFGELRVICEDNKFFFCAIDVCKALGYTNITRELNIHCRQDGIKSGRVEVAGIPRIVKFISEGNVYRLICRSNKPEAEQFENWVFDTSESIGGMKPMSKNDAARIAGTFAQYNDRVSQIIVHCDAGYSRSPAVAAALTKALGEDDSSYFGHGYCPNMHVYRLVLNELAEHGLLPNCANQVE